MGSCWAGCPTATSEGNFRKHLLKSDSGDGNINASGKGNVAKTVCKDRATEAVKQKRHKKVCQRERRERWNRERVGSGGEQEGQWQERSSSCF